MGKIPDEHECPVDVGFNKLAEALSPTFKKLHFTPNGITTLSLIFGLMAAWFLWKGRVWLFAISYIISFFFDCMDGHYARKYKMTSKFGDWYDHIKDWSVFIILIVVIVIKYKNRCSPTTVKGLIAILVIITVLNAAFVGCQARTHKDGASLTIPAKMCVGDPIKNMKWIRYFGPGTWTLVFVAMVIAMDKQLCV
jgi:phosphatidylglycerophosphate synthase